MGFFDGFPFTNTHQLNLDWILQRIGKVDADSRTAVEAANNATEAANNANASARQAIDTSAEAVENSLTAAEQAAASAAAAARTAGENAETAGNALATAENALETAENAVSIASGYGWIESDEYAGCYYRLVDGDVKEWLNPPMVLREEYRTVKRWKNLIVYTQAIPMDNFPVNSFKTTAIGTTITSMVNFHGELFYNGEWIPFPVYVNKTLAAYCWFSDSSVGVSTVGDISSGSAHFVLEYTKEG